MAAAVQLLVMASVGLCLRMSFEESYRSAAEEDTTQACLKMSHEEFTKNFKPDADCSRGSYPRHCLMSSIPTWKPYNHVRHCFSCCMKVWTAKLGLDKNFAHHEKIGHLQDEMKLFKFHHEIDEVLLTPNSLMKFAHVAFIQNPKCFNLPDLCRRSPPTYDSFFNAAFTEVDPPHHRPCVEVQDRKCVIPRGGLVLWRAFDYSNSAARNVAKWATHSNFSILLEGDNAVGNPLLWEASGGNVRRTNFDRSGTGDRGFYPLGTNARWETSEQVRAFSSIEDHSRSDLLYCQGLGSLQYVPIRSRIISTLSARGFDCSANQLPNEEYIHRLGESKFVVSPQGVGHNCYRTWEALTAGAIPIISWYPGVEKLYEGLPVVISNDYTEITPDYLMEQYTRIQKDEALSLSKAYLPYWLGIIFADLEPIA